MNFKLNALMCSAAAVLLSGCASIVSGTEQDITIDSNPKGAECVLVRDNKTLREVNTPETIRISKLKHDIYATCNLDGFHESTAHINSGTQGSVFGNILLGGGIGWAVDSARGADNKYPEVVTITMVPLSQPAPEAVTFEDTEGVVGENPEEAEVAEEAEENADSNPPESNEN